MRRVGLGRETEDGALPGAEQEVHGRARRPELGPGGKLDEDSLREIWMGWVAGEARSEVKYHVNPQVHSAG